MKRKKESHEGIQVFANSYLILLLIMGARVAQWWRSGGSTHLPPIWPGFESRRRCGLSWLLVLSLAPRNCSPGTPVFPSPGFVQIFGSKIQDVFQTFFQNNNLFIQTQGDLIGDQHPANRACFCLFVFFH